MYAPSVAIAGIGETPHARHLNESLAALCIDAVLLAAEDAGIAVEDIDGIVTDNLHVDQVVYDVLPTLRLDPNTFVAQSGSSGAGTMSAALIASMAIEAGLARNVVCFFGSTYGSAVGGPYSHHAHDNYKTDFELSYGFFPQAAYMAMMARAYLESYGFNDDDLAAVAMSSREWAHLHPDATKRSLMSLDDYRASAMVADPLRNADCSLISDGAAAYVMTSLERARDLRRLPIRVRGVGRSIEHVTEHSHLGVRPDLLTMPSRFSGPAALEMARMTTADVDFVELYDCFSIIPVIQLEDIGFYGKGEALAAYVRGDSSPGGALPVNTHGGLLAHSYLLGVSHLCEAVKQLRGDAGDRQVPDARVGLVTGWAAMEHASLVLSNDE